MIDCKLQLQSHYILNSMYFCPNKRFEVIKCYCRTCFCQGGNYLYILLRAVSAPSWCKEMDRCPTAEDVYFPLKLLAKPFLKPTMKVMEGLSSKYL